MHRHGLVWALATMLLASGCASRADHARPAESEPVLPPVLEAVIPLPRDGDQATYSTDSYRSLFEIHAAWVGSPALGNVPYPMLTRAYAPLDAAPDWPPYREAIDPASNRLLWTVDPCPFNLDGECKGPYHDAYETWRNEVAGLPWGYGSSIFQGRLLREGLVFNETFPLGLVPVTLRFEVVAARVNVDVTEFDVVGTLPFSGNATEMIAGAWRLSSGSPFVLTYSTNLTLAGTRTSTFSFGINATLGEWTRGTGPIIVDENATWKPTPPDLSKALAFDRGLPVGADAELGFDGYTFRGAWQHLLREEPEVAAASVSPGFRLWHMQVPREETSGGLVLQQHHVEGSFSFYHGERFDSAFVAHDCSWVDVLQLELSCDYSGSGPTDGLQ
ncbi:MAG TPA: hypothetical protein VGB18_04165, partial [Candidatus Thermoplasmatota archaeon]